MEQNVITQDNNPVKEKILLLKQKASFKWSEIARVTGFKKRTVKAIAKGNLVLAGETSDQLCKILDETIEQINIEVDEADFDAEDYRLYKLDVKSVSVYKGTDDDKMVIQIQGHLLE